jgi:hypothetical protein
MRALAPRVLPIATAVLVLVALALPPARAVSSSTAASTLQFYGVPHGLTSTCDDRLPRPDGRV